MFNLFGCSIRQVTNYLAGDNGAEKIDNLDLCHCRLASFFGLHTTRS